MSCTYNLIENNDFITIKRIQMVERIEKEKEAFLKTIEILLKSSKEIRKQVDIERFQQNIKQYIDDLMKFDDQVSSIKKDFNDRLDALKQNFNNKQDEKKQSNISLTNKKNDCEDYENNEDWEDHVEDDVEIDEKDDVEDDEDDEDDDEEDVVEDVEDIVEDDVEDDVKYDKKPLRKYTEEEFIKLVQKCKTLTEIAKCVGTNTEHVRNRLKKLDDKYTEHLLKYSSAKKIKLFDETTDEELIIIIKKYKTIGQISKHFGIKNTTRIRNRLKKLDEEYKEHLYKYEYEKNAIYKNMPIEELKEIVENNTTWTNILKVLGYRGPSHNGEKLRLYLNKNNINYSHLASGQNWQYTENGKKLLKNTVRANKIPIEEILVEHSTYTNGQELKKRLIKEKGFIDKCAICNKIPTDFEDHEDLDLAVFQLDHINGVNDDDRIRNLRILCGTCHTRTKTYGRKNKAYLTKEEKEVREANKKHCITCNVEICKDSQRCSKCNGLASRSVKRPSLDELLHDVDTIGYVATGKKYGVTDNTIRKWFKSYGVEPPRIKASYSKKIKKPHTEKPIENFKLTFKNRFNI